MGLFKKQENSGIKCPACGSIKNTVAKGTQAVVAYPGFYSGVSNDSEAVKGVLRKCKECNNVFKVS